MIYGRHSGDSAGRFRFFALPQFNYLRAGRHLCSPSNRASTCAPATPFRTDPQPKSPSDTSRCLSRGGELRRSEVAADKILFDTSRRFIPSAKMGLERFDNYSTRILDLMSHRIRPALLMCHRSIRQTMLLQAIANSIIKSHKDVVPSCC